MLIGTTPLSSVCGPCAAARSVSPTTAVLVLLAAVVVVAVACVTARRVREIRFRQAALTIALTASVMGAATWLFINGSVEMQPILVLSSRHGITTGDLAALPFLASALWAALALRSTLTVDHQRP